MRTYSAATAGHGFARLALWLFAFAAGLLSLYIAGKVDCGEAGPVSGCLALAIPLSITAFYLYIIFKASDAGRLNVVVTTVSIVLTIALMEGSLRFVEVPDAPRFLFWSSGHFSMDDNGAVRYRPGERVRTVTVYGGKIEYDVQYSTNNLGLIDDRPYYRDDRQIPKYVFAGDSFTAGHHGGRPWVPALRDRVQRNQDLEIYNLGVTGTGFHHFKRLLESFSREIDFTDVVLLAISNDFYRGYWYPVISGNEIRFCREVLVPEQCIATIPPTAYVIPYNATDDEIIAMASRLAKSRSLSGGGSRIVGMARRLYRAFGPAKSQQAMSALNAIEKIKLEFPQAKIHLVHLPEKAEVQSGEYELDVEALVAGSGIDYFPALHKCEWSVDMYHERDSHPNSRGYDAVSSCVGRYLGFSMQQ